MVSTQSVHKQLKRLKYNYQGWGRTEVAELPHILMPDEEIYELVNGTYEGGFALLVATDARVLLVDHKPLNYLTVEDLRFDMINELDYNHRLIGAAITISAGSKTLKFKSYNQPRLRKLISHVQHCMADTKKQQSSGQQDQKQHLEQINQQLQAYLIAQHQQQQTLLDQLKIKQKSSTQTAKNDTDNSSDIPSYHPSDNVDFEPAKPSPELSDFLFAQSLLKQYRDHQSSKPQPESKVESKSASMSENEQPAQRLAQYSASAPQHPHAHEFTSDQNNQMADLYSAGMQEIYGKQPVPPKPTPVIASNVATNDAAPAPSSATIRRTPHTPLEINALAIAYSKLPMALRNRKFGRPSFHAHSQAEARNATKINSSVFPDSAAPAQGM